MTSGVVKSTPTALEAIRNMQNIINGGLTETIQQLVTQGDRLNPGEWDGTHAAGFYESWPQVKSGLQNAVQQLNELQRDIQTVNTNIQSAGGN